jgi:AAA15 family ATPase/GTPase
MTIKKAEIKKFRGFEDVEFNLGSQLTVIAGQNGTQKTTILGMLSQPFTITDPDNPMKDEKPLCGGSFKSAFNEKFKLSDVFDKAKNHEWTLHLKNELKPFIIESISRNKKAEKNGIRFWRKGDRSKGSGYIQLPVIYLSLKRLFPIGEDAKLNESSYIKLTPDEEEFYKEWHSKLLISLDKFKAANYLESPNKNTLGITTDVYDWKQNSAGQDNIGKILLAILSFRRLKEKYKSNYQGGILAIDELDATLYPASQIKLIEALRKFASNFSIQVIVTTHSLSIMEAVCALYEKFRKIEASKDQIRVIFLEKRNNNIHIIPEATFAIIKHRLNVTIEGNTKRSLPVFTEDTEAALFAKGILKRRASKLNFINCKIGCSVLIDLATRKIPSFIFPNSLIFLDGDVSSESRIVAKIRALKNIIILPSTHSPERLIADFLFALDDNSNVWKKINRDFTKQYCFKDYTLDEIIEDRVKAKLWFNSHLKVWGRNASKVINPWIEANPEMTQKFIKDYEEAYNKFAKELSLESL